MGNFKEDIARVKAFVFDVDGVFTDGGIMPLPDGDFIRKYNAKDGYALVYAHRMGYKVCIITGGRGELLRRRFAYYKVTRFIDGCTNKIVELKRFMADEGLDPSEVIFMGDDIPDLECMRAVGIPVAPADACSEIIEAARYVSEFGGGRGCVRDIIEQTLRSQDKWAKSCEGVAGDVTSA